MENKKNKSETWLKYMIEELNIDIKEFADVIGKNDRQLRRYKTDGFPHNKNGNIIKQKCFDYICKKSCFKTYHHIENRIFFKIFKDYFNALNSQPETKVTQKNIADFMGVEQKTISSWMNPGKNKQYTRFSTKRQYQILNFFFSQSMKYLGIEMFSLKFPEHQANNFDYLGYYAIHQNLEYYLKFPKSFFYLMQNGKILSEVDKFMIDYIDMPKELYLMLMRQFEACLRCTKYLPSSIEDYRQRQYLSVLENRDIPDTPISYYPEMKQQYDIYKNLDFSTFFKIVQNTYSALQAKAEILMNKKGYSWNQNTADHFPFTMLERQMQAVSACPFFGTKSEQYYEIQQIRSAFSNWKISEYRELYKKIISMLENDEIYENSKQAYFISISEAAVELSCRPEVELILHHLPAFLDLDFLFNFSNNDIPFESSIFYPFIKKMLVTKNKTSVIREMEAEISKYSSGSFTNLIIENHNYQSIKTEYRKNHDKLQKYLSVCKIKELDMISYLSHFDFHSESENAVRLYEAFDNYMCNLNFSYGETNILELILDKLRFHAEDWYLWGLVRVGMDVNPGMTVQKILDFMETPEEILTFYSET